MFLLEVAFLQQKLDIQDADDIPRLVHDLEEESTSSQNDACDKEQAAQPGLISDKAAKSDIPLMHDQEDRSLLSTEKDLQIKDRHDLDPELQLTEDHETQQGGQAVPDICALQNSRTADMEGLSSDTNNSNGDRNGIGVTPAESASLRSEPLYPSHGGSDQPVIPMPLSKRSNSVQEIAGASSPPRSDASAPQSPAEKTGESGALGDSMENSSDVEHHEFQRRILNPESTGDDEEQTDQANDRGKAGELPLEQIELAVTDSHDIDKKLAAPAAAEALEGNITADTSLGEQSFVIGEEPNFAAAPAVNLQAGDSLGEGNPSTDLEPAEAPRIQEEDSKVAVVLFSADVNQTPNLEETDLPMRDAGEEAERAAWPTVPKVHNEGAKAEVDTKEADTRPSSASSTNVPSGIFSVESFPPIEANDEHPALEPQQVLSGDSDMVTVSHSTEADAASELHEPPNVQGVSVDISSPGLPEPASSEKEQIGPETSPAESDSLPDSHEEEITEATVGMPGSVSMSQKRVTFLLAGNVA